MAEITATMRQLLDQVGVSTLADLTGERAADPYNPFLQLVDNLLKEALDEAARAERHSPAGCGTWTAPCSPNSTCCGRGEPPPGCPPTTPANQSRNGSGWPPPANWSRCWHRFAAGY